MLFWIVLVAIIGALAVFAWWFSGPRFARTPPEALPPSHTSPGLGHPFGNGGGGAGA